MRLAMNRNAGPRLGRLPRPTGYSIAELLLLALVAVQASRLVWTLAVPVGPVGDWRPSSAALYADDSALADFDPFFRLAEAGTATVTTLDLKLYGVREDRATGRGSAIIALPDGTQRSFAVGEEIVPGVSLVQVDFDNVTIDRNGSREQIFLDQSEPAPAAAATAATTAPGQAAPAPAPSAPPPIRLQPRMNAGQIDGVLVSPGGDGGQAFRSAGFVPGDAIVSINGQRVTSMEQARALLNQSGGGANVIVERDGRAVPMRVRINQ